MPNDFAIRPTTLVTAPGAAPVAVEPASAARSAAPAAEAASTQALPNPTMRLDPALGLVVIEFHNQAGGVTASIPGQRQLDAYRTARVLNNGPDLGPGGAPASPGGIHPSATRTV